jgi:hypothetical protein
MSTDQDDEQFEKACDYLQAGRKQRLFPHGSAPDRRASKILGPTVHLRDAAGIPLGTMITRPTKPDGTWAIDFYEGQHP